MLQGETQFRHAILTASKHAIPAGFRREYKPGIPREAAEFARRRDNIRATNPLDPEIEELNRSIAKLNNESSRQIWREKVESSGHHLDSSKFWGLLRNLSGKRPTLPPNQPINFGTRAFSGHKSIAKGFIRQFVSTPRSSKLTRRFYRQIHRNHTLDHGYSHFSTSQVEEAIKSASNSTATGPDGLTSLHLKHFG